MSWSAARDPCAENEIAIAKAVGKMQQMFSADVDRGNIKL